MFFFHAPFFCLPYSLNTGLTIGSSALADTYVPPELEPWREWVLEGKSPNDCPLSGNDELQRNCVWPGRLRG